MSKQFQFSYQCPTISLLGAAADAAGRTSTYKSLRNCSGKVYIKCEVNQGNAAQVTFTPLQAQDSSGTGSKAIPSVPIFYNADTSASDTLVAQTAAASFQADATTSKVKFVVFEFDPAELDMANGFNHIAIQTSASNAANITQAEMQYLGRYQQAAPPASEV
jgi:hypothetical protein